MMKRIYDRPDRGRSLFVVCLLLITLCSLSLWPEPVQAASNRADIAVYFWLSPEGDQRSNVVEPGEVLYLDMQIENVGDGDASSVSINVPYNRREYVLMSEVSELREDEFMVQTDLLPPNEFSNMRVTLRVRSDVAMGSSIRIGGTYEWDDARNGGEGRIEPVQVWVNYRDSGDDDDTNDDSVRVIDNQSAPDTTPPDSCILGIARQSQSNYLITWGGTDEGGIASYDVQVQQLPNGLWRDWQTDTTDTSAVFGLGPEESNSFGFRVRARDMEGNEEAWPVHPQLTTSQADVMLPRCPGSGGTDAV